MSSLAAMEPDVRAFEADVRRVDGRDVVLEQSYFYPEGGGQPADRGTIDGVPVEHVRKGDSGPVHTLTSDPDFAAGDTVTGVVDDDFRTYCMRAHTASHLLYGAGRRLLAELGYGGFDIDDEKVRVDFSTTTTIDDEVLVELERLTNRAVWDAYDVTWAEVPTEEATAREAVAFNTKTQEGIMADADSVRLVTIGDEADPWDVAACGGTHVSNTREIGPVEVLGRSNPGEGLTRVEFAVGPSGIDRRAAVHRAALDASQELGVPAADVGEAAAALAAEKSALEDEVTDLKADVLERRVGSLEALTCDGATWRVGSISGFGPNEVGDAAQDAVGEAGDVICVVGASDAPFVVVASDGEAANAGDVVSRLTDEFGGGGGGGPTFAQGGGLDAAPGDVVESLRTH